MEVDGEETKEDSKERDSDRLVNIRSSVSLSLDMGEKEQKAFQQLEKIKVQYEKENIYIFDCLRCSNFVGLHEAKCQHC